MILVKTLLLVLLLLATHSHAYLFKLFGLGGRVYSFRGHRGMRHKRPSYSSSSSSSYLALSPVHWRPAESYGPPVQQPYSQYAAAEYLAVDAIMRPPRNILYIIQGEVCVLLTAMRRGPRWSNAYTQQDEDQDVLVKNFSDLKSILGHTESWEDLDPSTVISPFLSVIRDNDTAGPVTGLALSAVNKLLSYSIIDPGLESASVVVDSIADAVTHARFVGTETSSDEVVLLKILQVLRSLLLIPAGRLLSNETVCEMMQSCFRLCFEPRLSELLRRSAESILCDMTQLLFTRLADMKPDDCSLSVASRKLRMRRGSDARSRRKGKMPRLKFRRRQDSKDIQCGVSRRGLTPQNSTDAECPPHVQKVSASGGTETAPAVGAEFSGDVSVPAVLTEPDTVSIPVPTEPDTVSTAVLTDQDTVSVPAVLTEPDTVSTAVLTDQDTVSVPAVLTDQDTVSTAVLTEPDTVSIPVPTEPDTVSTAVLTEPHNVSIPVPTEPDTVSTAVLTEPHNVSGPTVLTEPDTVSNPAVHTETNDSVTPSILHSHQSGASDTTVASPISSDVVIIMPAENETSSCDDKLPHHFTTTTDTDQSATVMPDVVKTSEPGGATCEDLTSDSQYVAENSLLSCLTTLEEDSRENPQGVRFTGGVRGAITMEPYGVPCVRELVNFVASLINPLDSANSEFMLHCGLTLLAVVMETGGGDLARFPSIMTIVKDDICRNLFSLLNWERLTIFGACLRVCLLLFECVRGELKFQLEMYLTRVIDIVVSDSPRVSYEQKELCLDALVQLWNIPGLVTELYLNYDCDIYCSNVFEDITKLLSKNVLAAGQGVFSTHLLSLDALLTVVGAIEHRCHTRVLAERHDKLACSRDTADTASLGADRDDSVISPENSARSLVPLSGYASAVCQRQAVSSTEPSQARVTSAKQAVLPTHEQLMAVKHKKKLLASGTEHFNVNSVKGVQFLQDNGLLSSPIVAEEVVHFLKENPKLDKKMIGEYVSNRRNLEILDAFVKSFDFAGLRVDESLRLYLETFRLPGEAPIISLLMEHFAEHWHKSNGEPFANCDCAFTLAYAIIMLNVDQHNHNAKKNIVPMTRDDFKRNLKSVNGGADFNQQMLDDIYTAIKCEEIVMPAEQTGVVRDNYLWKVLLRRGETVDAQYVSSTAGHFDHHLYSLCWSPTLTALCQVFERVNDEASLQKTIGGLRKCAMIAAHYDMTDCLDSIILALYKFASICNLEEPGGADGAVLFGCSGKIQLACRTLISLSLRHGDALSAGWMHVLHYLLQLFRCRLLPESLTTAEDFLSSSGVVSLVVEPTVVTQRVESGLFSSLYSYIALGSELQSPRAPSAEDLEHKSRAKRIVRELSPEHLIYESKFLRVDSLHQLISALIEVSRGPNSSSDSSDSRTFDEESSVFFLELLIKVTVENRDRVAPRWLQIRDHIHTIIVTASQAGLNLLLQRSVVALLRLVIRLVRREELTRQVVQSLHVLLALRGAVVLLCCRHVTAGVYHLVRTAAVCLHASHWHVLFALLECYGAGVPPAATSLPHLPASAVSQAFSNNEVSYSQDSGHASDRCYSDSELYDQRSSSTQQARAQHTESDTVTPSCHSLSDLSTAVSGDKQRAAGVAGGWILVGDQGELESVKTSVQPCNQYSISHHRQPVFHDPLAYLKTGECLAFLVRESELITGHNLAGCVQCLRTYVEASVRCAETSHSSRQGGGGVASVSRGRRRGRRGDMAGVGARRRQTECNAPAPTPPQYDADESDSESELLNNHLQLLDLMHSLHTRTGQICESERVGPWETGWCPLLQGMARLCCDARKQVRASAVTYLQRALLMHGLQTLSPCEWEACFHKVLFPLLARLSELDISVDGIDETRTRISALLCKVFLQHLTPLLSLPTFTALWLTILDFMDKYLHIGAADVLREAIPESLKNMLLVMDTAGIFHTSDGYTQLWAITWDRIDTFLPLLRQELFKNHASEMKSVCSDGSVQHTVSSVRQEVRPSSPLHSEQGLCAGAAVGIILQPPLPAVCLGSGHVTSSTPLAPVTSSDPVMPSTTVASPTLP